MKKQKQHYLAKATKLDLLIAEIIELTHQQKAIEEQIQVIKDQIKDSMDKEGLERIDGAFYYCTYKTVMRSVVDANRLKRDNLYYQYTTLSESKRFDYNVIK